MKRKILAFIVLFIIAFNTVSYAEYTLGIPENQIELSGVATSYADVSILILNSDNLSCTDAQSTKLRYEQLVTSGTTLTTNEIFYFATEKADKDGKWKHVVPVDSSIVTGSFTFISNFGDLEFIKYGSYTNRMGIVEILKTAAGVNDDGTTLSLEITSYIDYIADRSGLYKNLSNKKQVALITKSDVAALVSDSTALDKLKNLIDTAIIIQTVNEGKTSDFDLATSIFTYNTGIVNSMNVLGKVTALSLMKGGNYSSPSTYKTAFETQLALQGFNYNKNLLGENLVAYLSNYSSYFSSLDLTEYNALLDTDKAYALSELAKLKSTTVPKMQENLDTIIAGINIPVITPPTGGGGGGGGGGGAGGGTPATPHPSVISGENSSSNDYINQQKYVYSDLTGSEWALDAISYLSKEGIISGYGNGEFKPLNPITRAEFVKLIVSTFYKYNEPSKVEIFNDVSSDAWYSDYVNIAYEKNIISGTGNGNFSPDNEISRQDMAVIILNVAKEFNLIETTNKGGETFNDDSLIADYAKNAVYLLKDAGILNGVGNGQFAPKDNGNRAAAAQILYSLINISK